MSRPRRSGLTLIEVLITLALVGVMGSIVVLGTGAADRGLTVETETNRLAERLRFAVDEALVTQRPLALAWDETGYGFVTVGDGGVWREDHQPLLGPRHDLPRGVSLSGDGAQVVPIALDGGAATELRIDGRGGERRLMFDGLNVIVAAETTRP